VKLDWRVCAGSLRFTPVDSSTLPHVLTRAHGIM
jgi:hypothetical protein